MDNATELGNYPTIEESEGVRRSAITHLAALIDFIWHCGQMETLQWSIKEVRNFCSKCQILSITNVSSFIIFITDMDNLFL